MAEIEEKKAKHTLPGPIALAKEAWEIYKKRFWIIVLVFLLSILVVFGVGLVGAVIGVLTFFVVKSNMNLLGYSLVALVGVLFLAALIYFSTWFQAAYITAIRGWKNGVGVKAAYKEARPFIVPLLLTSLLSLPIVLGGVFLFLIPGIVFGIWFTFAQYVVICEKKRGLVALHTSREYFRGRFWGVLWRSIAVHIPEFLLSMVVGSIVRQGIVDQSFSGLLQVVSLVLVPFYMIYAYVLYTNLRETTKEVTTVPVSAKRLYIIVPLIGFIIVIFSASAAFPKLKELSSQFAKMPYMGGTMSDYSDATETLDQQMKMYQDSDNPVGIIHVALTQYYMDNKTYPASLDELSNTYTPYNLETLPEGVTYQRTENGNNYLLCVANTLCLSKDGLATTGTQQSEEY